MVPSQFSRVPKISLLCNPGQAVAGPQYFCLRNPINKQYGIFRTVEIKIVKKLGSGAYGEVALADVTHPAFEQSKAAVKTVRKDVPKRLGLEDKFLVEGRISIPLDHKNIVRTLGWCYDSKPLQLLLEYCAGRSHASRCCRAQLFVGRTRKGQNSRLWILGQGLLFGDDNARRLKKSSPRECEGGWKWGKHAAEQCN
ncbi:unnamed protein product [Caenorhabditis auriculariae]|uniref:Protein kinase domain-containing protein n=1 Tax=Caenorhabditis auriculariae TaxID=2777116 RepID=A0A8S1H891_9PELO|nr:unnamed protein product [Caenorhabditis auriculariae]